MVITKKIRPNQIVQGSFATLLGLSLIAGESTEIGLLFCLIGLVVLLFRISLTISADGEIEKQWKVLFPLFRASPEIGVITEVNLSEEIRLRDYDRPRSSIYYYYPIKINDVSLINFLEYQEAWLAAIKLATFLNCGLKDTCIGKELLRNKFTLNESIEQRFRRLKQEIIVPIQPSDSKIRTMEDGQVFRIKTPGASKTQIFCASLLGAMPGLFILSILLVLKLPSCFILAIGPFTIAGLVLALSELPIETTIEIEQGNLRVSKDYKLTVFENKFSADEIKEIRAWPRRILTSPKWQSPLARGEGVIVATTRKVLFIGKRLADDELEFLSKLIEQKLILSLQR